VTFNNITGLAVASGSNMEEGKQEKATQETEEVERGLRRIEISLFMRVKQYESRHGAPHQQLGR
jgi:predicted DNA binding CopG/RHH family protein